MSHCGVHECLNPLEYVIGFDVRLMSVFEYYLLIVTLQAHHCICVQLAALFEGEGLAINSDIFF